MMKNFFTAFFSVLTLLVFETSVFSEMDLCHEYVEKKEYDKAISECTKEISSENINPSFYYHRARAYRGKGQYDRAIDDYTKALSMEWNDNRRAYIYDGRGYAYYSKGQFDQTIADCTKAIELNPDYAHSYSDRGLAYQAKGLFEQAIADFDKSIELDPHYAFTYTSRGFALHARGQYDKAISDCNKAISLDPKYVNAYYNRGYIYYANGQYDLAITDFSKAIELESMNFWSFYSRGKAHYAKGQFDQAIADYQKSIEIKPENEFALIELLITYRKISKERAVDFFQEFKKYIMSKPSDNWIRTISNYYIGVEGLTEADILREARRGKNWIEINERLCEAYYYLGEEKLWKTDRKAAEDFFNKSLATNTYYFFEYGSAKAILGLMKEGKI